MTFTLEFEDGLVREWTLEGEEGDGDSDDDLPGATFEERTDYVPALFVDGPLEALEALRDALASDPKVCETAFENRYPSLHAHHADDPSRMLRVGLERVDEVRTLAAEIRGVYGREHHAPGTLRLFDVDLTPGFRYCLDEEIDPAPSRPLRTLEITVDDRALASGDLSSLEIDGESVTGDPADVLWSLGRRLERRDPDVLVVSHGDLVPAVERAAAAAGLEGVHLGRLPGWTKLAGESTYASYGQVGHSPARYRVPGRAIVDRSNSFLWHQSGLAGLEYLVQRSRKPLQEASWASIGSVLTAIQIREARAWGVPAPLNKWDPEVFKDVSTLHAADRGGFTFAPEVGLHEDVHELDFASLYPRIICRHNVSPETVGCQGGCRDIRPTLGTGREDGSVPELEYDVCATDGFLPAVLRPLLDRRAACKRRLRDDPGEDEAARLRAESGAIKWVLVSCFGYQGYRNAKFGRIECHEAINAHAREIALRAKERLEDAGWRIVHGIVDSLWVTPRVDEPDPLEGVIAEISRDAGIDIEHDGRYEWVCFVPLRESSGGEGERRSESGIATTAVSAGAGAGALTKYVGKRTTGEFKVRGLECRQRHTPAFVADCQREFLEVLDETRDPAAVCDHLARRLGDLRRGAVDRDDLVITKRVSRPLEAYSQETHVVGALRRYERHDVPRRPGQAVEYVVVDDGATRTEERVRLAFENADAGREHTVSDSDGKQRDRYDVDYYATLLLRAAESVTAALGWDRSRIRRALEDDRTVSLSVFTR
ncbi:DNA polymerase domain-containing protein [Natronosalvus caseinilyticus]|uniref:DNA polymerase domain-containing protein n=1 Tax=Natronosalvus caseinilyticus TaxID=2953747 RepID=UPI0028AD3FC2|nr:DNA polymerase domain-containing protein [Natronosalvus caseinilyticus]